ncbi:MAG TPA: hypothetical protein PKM84_02660 [Candidatus Pacearchaeota archaeon]|nr:hypothetical protein [Candidatus Pacearchaeota archaeon]
MTRTYKKLMSRYNPSPKIRKFPNLQKILVPADAASKLFKNFAGKKVRACAKCIKSLSKKK